MSDWQDISTAPKDGWLLLTQGGKIPYVGHWDDEEDEWFTFNLGYETTARMRSANFPLPYNPTHWMPLPQPPEQRETE